jgi:hypothetical protein
MNVLLATDLWEDFPLAPEVSPTNLRDQFPCAVMLHTTADSLGTEVNEASMQQLSLDQKMQTECRRLDRYHFHSAFYDGARVVI